MKIEIVSKIAILSNVYSEIAPRLIALNSPITITANFDSEKVRIIERVSELIIEEL